jgi:hypothetical protein
MKKAQFIRISLIVLGISVSTLTFAQSHRGHGGGGGRGPVTPVQQGDVIINLGVGVGADYRGDDYNTGFGTKIAIEKALWEAGPGVITLGGEVGGSFSNGGYYGNDNHYHSSTIVVAARAAWHYGWQVPGLDTYGGVSAGLGFHHVKYDPDYSHSTVIPVPGAFVGASYFVTPNFGFNAEAGYDITSVQVGLVFKIM